MGKIKQIKVLHINISEGGGGAAIATNRLHLLMNKTAELESKILVLVKSTESKSVYKVNWIQRQIARTALYLDKLLTWHKYRSFGLFSTAPFGISLKNNLYVEKTDIIYLHWVNNGFLGLPEIESIINLGKPTFLFCHDMWYFTGGCHQSYGCLKFQTGCNNCHFFKKNNLIDVAKVGFEKKMKIYKKNSRNTQFICPSTLWKNFALSNNYLPTNSVNYISNILDEAKFKPLSNFDKNLNIEKYIVLFGALGGKSNGYKGWEYFIEAMSFLPINLKNKIEVVLFGYEFSRHDLNELPFNVSSVGILNDEESMIELYQRSHVYVFPSLQESFGQTIYEAMACGVPTVAFPVGAVADLIEHKIDGYIAEYKNSRDLANGIKFILNNDQYCLYSIRARNKIVKEFNSSLIIQKHINLVKNSIKEQF